LRPLGLEALLEDGREAGLLELLLGLADDVLLAGVSFLAEPVDASADSGFCPITF